MGKIILIGLAAIVCGCATKQGDDGKRNDPIVSPTEISTEHQGDGAPVFPTWYVPWYKD